MTVLFDNISANATSSVVIGRGGPKIIFIRADSIGGGKLIIQVAPPSDTLGRFETLKDGSFVGSSDIHIDYLPTGTKIRAKLSGATGASNVFVEIL
tara:strand:- start:15098 stop:15385 length:288 start_codon:yes stop_codon:yes gene_type:complete